jgi:hypothetical protein
VLVDAERCMRHSQQHPKASPHLHCQQVPANVLVEQLLQRWPAPGCSSMGMHARFVSMELLSHVSVRRLAAVQSWLQQCWCA